MATIAVLGGGVAGLTVAHELVERGHDVYVFESRGSHAADLGGKARSFGSVSRGQPVFGEHGFRFFPGFYTHVKNTMNRIPLPGATGPGAPPDAPMSVGDRLVSLKTSSFYTKQLDAARPTRDGLLNRASARLREFGVVLFLAWLLVLGTLVWYFAPPRSLRVGWAVAPIVWLVARTWAFSRLVPSRNFLHVEVPTDDRPHRRSMRAQRWLIHRHRKWRWLGLLVPALAVYLVDRPLRLLLFAIILGLIVWTFPILATIRVLWGILQQIPQGVRPGILESLAASIRIVVVVASCERRTYVQWERDSWWSYIGAARFSRAFAVTFATGLTRSFVATRAEQMSARTGASILAQLLYDISPTLVERNPADQVLALPTHIAWIEPWVEYLRARGVRFNQLPDGAQLDRVIVDSIVCAAGDDQAPMIGGFRYRDREGGPVTDCLHHVYPFDQYVLAVSGTSSQRIIGNSPELIACDRRVRAVERIGDPVPDPGYDRSVPYLDAIFQLQFGWMTGLVFHSEQPLGLERGHHLCLESEWALTAIDYGPIWQENANWVQPALVTDPWQSILSVNISDWFSASPVATPAHFGDERRIVRETWRQLVQHIPELATIEGPPHDWVLDPAVEHAPSQVAPGVVGQLTNSEQLLVNTIDSWQRRPSAQTAFTNLVIAGDYVRTTTDFASMESANEAAKRAVNVILTRIGDDAERCNVLDRLPDPDALKGALKVMRRVDEVAYAVGLPHPLMVFATPIGWFAKAEQWARRWLLDGDVEADGERLEQRRRQRTT